MSGLTSDRLRSGGTVARPAVRSAGPRHLAVAVGPAVGTAVGWAPSPIRHPWQGVLLFGGIAALVGAAVAGPVAAMALATYAALAVTAGHHQWRHRRNRALRAAQIEFLEEWAARLRAGVGWGWGGSEPADPGPNAAAAVRVSETVGAPLADLLESIESDHRDRQRMHDLIAAETAGTRATGHLLLVLPVVGIGLTSGLGMDPLRCLLHTSLGALCAGVALLLQVVGFLWINRLVSAVLTGVDR